ncbi:MAG: hypothetical protein ACLPLR_14885 [Terriglobales bacterium]
MSLQLSSLIAFLLLASSQLANAIDKDACRAQVLMPDDLRQLHEIRSPDGQQRAVLSGYRERKDSGDGTLQVFHRQTLLRQFRLRDLSAGIYFKWAPDSTAFYLMWSDGGAIGNYHVRVFRVRDNRVLEAPTTRVAERDFAKRHYCKTRRNNVYAVHWLANSDEIVISTAVYPTSDCEDMGFTLGYLVRTDDGTIIKRYSQPGIEEQIKTCSAF